MLTGLQIINELEDRLGYVQSGTLEGNINMDTRKVLGLLNRVLKNMGAVEQWPMLRSEGTIITQAGLQYDMLLERTNGSDTLTISQYDSSGFTFEVTHKMWAIQIGSAETPIYRIAEIVSPTVVKLNRVWIGTTVIPLDPTDPLNADDPSIVGVGMTLAMDQYVLPEDFDRPTGDWEDFLSSYKIQGAGPEEFAKIRRGQGRTIVLDNPHHYTVYGLDPTESYQVLHLHPWPIEQTLLQYSYQRLHPTIEHDVDHVLFPQTNLGMIMEAVIYLANRDYEDDQRMQAALMEYMQQFKAIKGQNMVVQDKKVLTPWRGGRARSVRDTRGLGIARYDYGDYFDIAGNTKLP